MRHLSARREDQPVGTIRKVARWTESLLSYSSPEALEGAHQNDFAGRMLLLDDRGNLIRESGSV